MPRCPVGDCPEEFPLLKTLNEMIMLLDFHMELNHTNWEQTGPGRWKMKEITKEL